jgi:dolichol kinase
VPVYQEIQGAFSISAIFAVIIAVSEFISRKFNPSPEFTRKFVHMNGGIACLFFPFFVKSQFTVLALAALFSMLFYLGGKMKFLKCLHGVERKTRGSEYYPFAIWALFFLSFDRLWLYFSSVLVLTAADACAALIGEKYGSIRYKVGDSYKSLEGSLFFWIISFLAIQIPMLLLSGLPKETCILSALLVSFLMTCTEAVSVRGTDNIFVPVLTAYILLKITQKPVPEIAFQCASLFAIFAVFGLIIWRSRLLDIGAGLIFLGISYASWSLGSFQWALPAFAAFLLFTVVRYLLNRKKVQPVIRAKTFFAALALPFAILIFANSLDAYQEFFGIYLTV